MTRKLVSLTFLALFALAGCGKAKLPLPKKTAEASPAPVGEAIPAGKSAAAPALTPAPAAASGPATPAPNTIDTKAQVVVLCYHRLEGKAGGALSIEPELFKQQMLELKTRGLAVISMQDFLAWRRGEKTIPPKSVLITIDDGYVSGFEVGLPVLKEFKYPATYFIYTDYVNKGGKSMSWEQLAELRDAGIEIGSHTISHLSLKTKPSKVTMDYESWLKNELEGSKRMLEENLGIKVTTLAYPFGLHNEKVHAACRAAGYEAAFTTYGQRLGMTTAPFALGRYDVTTKDAQGHDAFSIAVSFQGMMAPGGGDTTLAQDAAVSMVTEPANGSTINTPTPVLKANLATMGELDPGSVKMRVSGVGEVRAAYDPASKNISYKILPEQKLKPGPVTVIISARSGARRLDARWNFHYDPAASTAGGTAAANEQLPPRPVRR
jgi:peptidoglycan/xylan/chitin deacetylase (PgdA/CDA1 family)